MAIGFEGVRMTKSWLIVQIALLAVMQACALITERPAEGLIVHITKGMISGKTDGEIEAYLNIPYAAAPTGERRWRPPADAASWSERGSRSACHGLDSWRCSCDRFGHVPNL